MSDREKYIEKLQKIADRHDPYVWSGQGQQLKKLRVLDLIELEKGNVDNLSRILKYIVKQEQAGVDMSPCRIFDCSGLVTYLLMKLGVLKSDLTAKGLYAECIRRNGQKTMKDLQPGYLVFKGTDISSIGHVGTYIGGGKVIEAKGRDYGVCYTIFDSRMWDFCGDIF